MNFVITITVVIKLIRTEMLRIVTLVFLIETHLLTAKPHIAHSPGKTCDHQNILYHSQANSMH